MSEKEEKADSPFWEGFGKLAAIIGVLGGAFALYQQVWPNEARVVATCREFELVLPDEPLVSNERIKEIAESQGPASGWSEPNRQKLALAIERVHAELDRAKSRLPGHLLTCAVANTGGRQAAGVALRLPGIAQSIRLDTTPRPATNPIELGDLRPGESKQLAIWWERSWFTSSREASLAYTEGRGVVQFPVEIFGWRDWLAWTISNTPFTVVLLLSFSFAFFINSLFALLPRRRAMPTNRLPRTVSTAADTVVVSGDKPPSST